MKTTRTGTAPKVSRQRLGNRPTFRPSNGREIVKPRPKTAKPPEAAEPEWNLRLYVAGSTPASDAAFSNLQQICELHLPERYRIEVIDLVKNPQIAREDQIVAVPMVVRQRPLPVRTIIGDMSNTERALAGLDLLRPGLSGAAKSRIVR